MPTRYFLKLYAAMSISSKQLFELRNLHSSNIELYTASGDWTTKVALLVFQDEKRRQCELKGGKNQLQQPGNRNSDWSNLAMDGFVCVYTHYGGKKWYWRGSIRWHQGLPSREWNPVIGLSLTNITLSIHHHGPLAIPHAKTKPTSQPLPALLLLLFFLVSPSLISHHKLSLLIPSAHVLCMTHLAS
jgi:hypothetical protein